ncbi:hypothetical protein CANCADRAFT_148023 [Tortispora caseinolytica NRRL Y-17796]|uniref:Pyrimidine 5'-nucleotidase n=1 Tax=Tortispora caseinolytica NRRL Y-17796 TaxID=767744 RepID=A0A1E4TG04_9ASCO|nr:hypothetical protein CANCADRAFT_148023 [Tortispora caseinolytica NRRL Y-17796]
MNNRQVFFFDIDNTLYSRSTKIHDIMKEKITEYFLNHLNLDPEIAKSLHQQYYKTYGLAIRGLILHHDIDPIDYNSAVDDAIPLQDILSRDEKLIQLLSNLDRQKVKPWLLTNAYVTHAKRTIDLIGVADQFEGLTYCDYLDPEVVCKPDPRMFLRAMQEAGATHPSECHFIDDSPANVKAALDLGFKTSILLLEPEDQYPDQPIGTHMIKSIHELPNIVPELFKGY